MKISTPPKTDPVVSRSPASVTRSTPPPGPIAPARSGTSAVPDEGEDRITLSSTAAQLIEIANATEDAEQAHHRHVELLKERVARDEYAVSPARVASAMFRDILAQGGAAQETSQHESTS